MNQIPLEQRHSAIERPVKRRKALRGDITIMSQALGGLPHFERRALVFKPRILKDMNEENTVC